jgi:hypothetical protein
MAARAKMAGDKAVSGKNRWAYLRDMNRLMRRSLAPGLIGILRPIVQAFVPLMLRTGQNLPPRRTVAGELIGAEASPLSRFRKKRIAATLSHRGNTRISCSISS